MDPVRQKRKQEISKALKFIQSSLAYPEPEKYQDFLIQLVFKQLEEGNCLFRDGEWTQAVGEFTEALNVSLYAAREDIHVPEALLESLHVNRAAAYHSMGDYNRGVADCDQALALCKDSCKALYRKALCLKALGKYREAYNCTTDSLLITRQDKDVNDLAQELAIKLGLKNRKPYVVAEKDALIMKVTNGNRTVEAKKKVSGAHLGNGINPLSSFAPVSFPSIHRPAAPSVPRGRLRPAAPLSAPDTVDALEDSELMCEDFDSLLDGFSAEPEPAEALFSAPRGTSTAPPSALPAPTPQLPSAFFNPAVGPLRSLVSFSAAPAGLDTLDHLLPPPGLDVLDDFGGTGRGADAADLGLTSALPETALNGLHAPDNFLDATPSAAAERVGSSRTELDPELNKLDLLDRLDHLESNPKAVGKGGNVPAFRVKALDQLDFLDDLDRFPSAEAVAMGTGLDWLSDFGSAGVPGPRTAAAVAPAAPSPKNKSKVRTRKSTASIYNPLASTHEFLQACSACFPRGGKGIHTFVHKPNLVHGCGRDVLLCRLRPGDAAQWTRVRPMPPCTSFRGPYVLCRELLQSGDLGVCKFGENCTFAFNQLEIDVWTEERRGTLDRGLLFKAAAGRPDPAKGVAALLRDHRGTFLFLCQECFDNKPTIISKRCKENPTVCSNLHVGHSFDIHKCLAFAAATTPEATYAKIRPLGVPCQLELCQKATRRGCEWEDGCHYAHSIVELKTWRLQRDTGISSDEIVKVAAKHHDLQEQNSSQQKWNRQSLGGGASKPGGGLGGGTGRSPKMTIKLACAVCWGNGLISEPDKARKYCNAKAMHKWTNDRRVLLVKSLERCKWVQVRPLPQAKNVPLNYELCSNVLEKKKCNYIGNCSFAHSQEERDLWTYMKNNNLRDIQQVHDTWTTLTAENRQPDEAAPAQSVPEEKSIAMPTDYAEPAAGFHCRLCGRNSNSERQWQQHISSEKHKARVFGCEGENEDVLWTYRFPGKYFELCPKLEGGCPDGVSCDSAHSPEELREWTERRDFLRQKVAKAREDMLLMPDELDFGNYNFLLRD